MRDIMIPKNKLFSISGSHTQLFLATFLCRGGRRAESSQCHEYTRMQIVKEPVRKGWEYGQVFLDLSPNY